MTKHNFKTK